VRGVGVDCGSGHFRDSGGGVGVRGLGRRGQGRRGLSACRGGTVFFWRFRLNSPRVCTGTCKIV
jgi:hypothetical protein